MTKESFEKLVENEQNKDEILQRVMTGLGVLNNDEEWYDICAEQYKVCNGNLGSFWQNLFKILDSHKYRKENLKIIEENDKKMIGMLEDMKKNMRSYIAKHPISKKNCGKEVVSAEIHDKIFPELIKVIFNEYKEPLSWRDCGKVVSFFAQLARIMSGKGRQEQHRNELYYDTFHWQRRKL